MKFSKLHGLGNDFLVLDRRGGAPWTTPERARALCDRHRGVGADGVLELHSLEGHHARLVIYNADGSRPEMCGNGVRCVGRYLADRREREPFGLMTDAGPRMIHRTAQDTFRVEMGAAKSLGPTRAESSDHQGHLLDLGNPHFVLFGEWPADLPGALGPGLERDPRFPEGANISFAQVAGPGVVRLVVWERGCGLTEACGTGACATATAAWLSGRAPVGVPLAIDLPGGRLVIEGTPAALQMTGPAEHVFDGTWVAD